MKKKLFIFIILLMIFVESFKVANAGTICCYYQYETQGCSELKSLGLCACEAGSTCPDTDVKSCGSCTCTPGTTTSCDYCSGSKKCVDGSKTCESWTSWGACTGGTCSCDTTCGAACAPAGTQQLCGTRCLGKKYCVSTKTCQQDCTWGSCVESCDCDYGCNAECLTGETTSCDYCGTESCPQGGYKYCTGTKSCRSDCTWGSCSGGSCSCVAGKCGVPTATLPNVCSTRCKDSSTVEYYCGSGSGCGWKPYICDLAFCDSSVGKCTCTQQYCDNLPLGGLGYKRGSKCVSYEKTDSCNIGGCSESSSCSVSEKACGCDSIADCCSQAATNSYVRGKCMQCVSSSKTCDLVDTNSCPQYYSLCCKFDSDCTAKDNIKGKCDSPSGTGHVSGSYTYTCVWPPCSKNDECADNSCCVTSSQDSNVANQGKCVSQGIYSNNPKWLCDPPNGWASNRIEPETKTQNILELIISAFSHFFFQR